MPKDQENPQNTNDQDLKESEDPQVINGSKPVEEVHPSSPQALMPSSPQEAAAAAETPSPPSDLQGLCSSSTSIPATSSCKSDEGSSGEEEMGKPSASQAESAPENIPTNVLDKKVALLVNYMLLKYQMKEPIRKADMLEIVIREYEHHFPEILQRASQRMEIIFGLDVKEVDPTNQCYGIFIKLGLTYDGMTSSEDSVPKTGLLILILGMIFMKGNRATEEEIWEMLNMTGMYSERKHCIFGNPKELITKEFVKEKYLEYQRVGSGDPVQYEFRWGPRAHAETSKMKVLQFVAKVLGTNPSDYPSQFEEAVQEEEERMLARMALRAASSSVASASSSAPASSFSHK